MMSNNEIDNLGDYTIAPQHGNDLAELEPYIIEGVAYSPQKMTFACGYDDEIAAYCNECDWSTTIGKLPEDSGTVVPDKCPDCAKDGELGFVRTESPADGTLPSGWSKNEQELEGDNQ